MLSLQKLECILYSQHIRQAVFLRLNRDMESVAAELDNVRLDLSLDSQRGSLPREGFLRRGCGGEGKHSWQWEEPVQRHRVVPSI